MSRIAAIAFLMAAAYAQTAQPSTVTLTAGQTQQFSAPGAPAGATYDWEIDTTWCGGGSVSAGAIDSSTGLYHAPSSVTAQQTVRIGVSINGGFSCAATVTLVPGSTPPPAPSAAPSSLVSPLSFGMGLLIGSSPADPATLQVSVDGSQVIFQPVGAPAPGTACGSTFQIGAGADGASLVACIAGTWRRFVATP